MHIADKDLVGTLARQGSAPHLAAAVYTYVPTSADFTRWLGPLGYYLVARPAARVAAYREGRRAEMPLDGGIVLGLDPEALHMWSADPMISQVHDHLGRVPLSRINAVRAETGKRWWPLAITVAGAKPVSLKARGNVPDFVAALQMYCHHSAS